MAMSKEANKTAVLNEHAKNFGALLEEFASLVDTQSPDCLTPQYIRQFATIILNAGDDMAEIRSKYISSKGINHSGGERAALRGAERTKELNLLYIQATPLVPFREFTAEKVEEMITALNAIDAAEAEKDAQHKNPEERARLLELNAVIEKLKPFNNLYQKFSILQRQAEHFSQIVTKAKQVQTMSIVLATEEGGDLLATVEAAIMSQIPVSQPPVEDASIGR